MGNAKLLRQCRVRAVTETDLDGLCAIDDKRTLHRDRIREASAGDDVPYYLVEADGAAIACCLLVFRVPDSWPQDCAPKLLPALIDLEVRDDLRSCGVGALFVGELERIARARGCDRLYIGVDPIDNPRAFAFYLRLGYQPTQEQAVWSHWAFTDSAGKLHQGDEWSMVMVKDLG